VTFEGSFSANRSVNVGEIFNFLSFQPGFNRTTNSMRWSILNGWISSN